MLMSKMTIYPLTIKNICYTSKTHVDMSTKYFMLLFYVLYFCVLKHSGGVAPKRPLMTSRYWIVGDHQHAALTVMVLLSRLLAVDDLNTIQKHHLLWVKDWSGLRQSGKLFCCQII